MTVPSKLKSSPTYYYVLSRFSCLIYLRMFCSLLNSLFLFYNTNLCLSQAPKIHKGGFNHEEKYSGRKEGFSMELLIVALILILALIAIRISDKIGIPALLLFLLLGVVFNFTRADFDNFEFADSFASLALMVIIFYGGFGTKWKMAKPVAKEAITLSSLGVFVTAILTGLFAHYVLGFELIEALLLGSIVGSTDYASVASILQSRNLNLKYNTAPLLELESGSNDPSAYTMVLVFLSLLLGQDVSIPRILILQIGLGVLFGFLIGYIFIKLLNRFAFDEGYLVIFLAAFALITYELTNQFSGNGYLAVYIFGIYIGNQEFTGKREVVFFFDGLTNIFQIGLFFILGLLSNPAQIISAMPVALIIMIFMTLIARPLSVYGLMLPFKLEPNQLAVISVAGLRGAAAIAFAIFAVNSAAPLQSDIYHIVFDICLLSSLIQGTLLPIASRRLDMLDPSDTVLRTFNSYQDKSPVGFFKTTAEVNGNLAGKKISDLNIEFDFIVAKIIRDNQTIIPRGDVVLEPGDRIILSAEQYFDPQGEDLTQFTINDMHQWAGKTLYDLDFDDNFLIIMVQRDNGDILVPSGNTRLESGDTVIAFDAT